MSGLIWIDELIKEEGVTECKFCLESKIGIVPDVLWLPTQQTRPVPLVLLGHGGSSHKRSER